MYTIDRVEEQLYDPGNGGEPLIGLTIFYTDGGVNQIGPILIRSEMDALLQNAYNDGFKAGRKHEQNDVAPGVDTKESVN